MKRIYTFLLAAMATTLCVTAQSTGNTHEYVDLGLPSGVRWATCNVGADAPEGFGNYYAWGETEPKESYSWDTYKYGTYSYNYDYSTLTKYNNTDRLTTLEAADDAATANWGEGWRMPTIAELNELEKECDWTWTADYNSTGIAGYIVASKTNSNSIFLPAAGEYFYSDKKSIGKVGRYWTSTLEKTELEKAELYYFSQSTTKYSSGGLRFYGCSVRPVIMVYGITVAAAANGAVTADKEAYAGQEITLTVTPATGYELDVLTVKDAAENTITVENNKFTMPASAVTVTATFKAVTPTALQNAEMVEIYAADGRIYGADGMQIFTLTGQNVTEMNGSLNGVYIVKIGDKAQKVIVSSK